MSDLCVMRATLASEDYVSFTDPETFKGIAEWSDAHQADVSMQLSEYVKSPEAYIVRLSDAQLSEDELDNAFEKGRVDIAGIKFYVTEVRRIRFGTSMM